MAILLDGKNLAKKIRADVAEKVLKLKEKYNKVPGLAVVLVGTDPASQVYVSKKEKMSVKAGMLSKKIELPETTSEAELIKIVEDLNNDDDIHGILVQLPLPKHIDSEKVIMTIKPEKDVDGFHPINVGRMLSGLDVPALSCTPAGIMKFFEEYDIDLKGKNAVVIGRSNIVGKPMSVLLLAKHATVTICHSRTQNIDEICRRADIIVVAIGREKFLQADWVKEGTIVVDVGMNRSEESGKLVGDVDFDNIEPKASYITPVPGGVGPMTIAMLLSNTVDLFERAIK